MIQKINNLLARSIVSLNAILAIVLVVFGTIFGITAGMAFLGPLALIVGPFIGIAAAIVVCGLLAVLLDLRDLLVEIRDNPPRHRQKLGSDGKHTTPIRRGGLAEPGPRPGPYTLTLGRVVPGRHRTSGELVFWNGLKIAPGGDQVGFTSIFMVSDLIQGRQDQVLPGQGTKRGILRPTGLTRT